MQGGGSVWDLRANARQELRFFALLRMTLARLVILNEVKDLWQTEPLPVADRNLLLGRPRREVVDTPSAGPHRINCCSVLLGIATVGFSLVPQVVSREKSVGIQGT